MDMDTMGHGDGLWGWVGWAEEDKGGKTRTTVLE